MNQERKPLTMGLIVGNRGFFPDHLCLSGRATMIEVLENAGIQVIALSPDETPYGSVESLEDARRCASLFKEHREEIDGVIVTLPNFGDERAVANTLRWSDLNVPVLIHAYPDDANTMTVANRRDSFCGKISVCNNLRQYGIKYSLTELHTVDPKSTSFSRDLERFAGICRVVAGLMHARIGVIGARPAAFNTVRYSEKLLENAGISVESLDLSEVFGRAESIPADDPRLKAKLDQLMAYLTGENAPSEAMHKIARFGAVVDAWMDQHELTGTAIQCWTSMEEYYGVVPCAIMSMMSNDLMPSACETDIVGVVGMLALALASGKPSAIVDWNNNYGDDPDKGVVFHCSNLPRDMFVRQEVSAEDSAKLEFHDILSVEFSKENAFGTVVGRVRSDAFTYCRVSTDDLNGKIVAYVGQGETVEDPLKTWGGYGVVKVPAFQKLLHYICENGLEHHVAMNFSETAATVEEALANYLGWDVYNHDKEA